MHLEDEQIQRMLHDELDASSQAALGRHLDSCDSCRRRLEEARREDEWVFGLLRRVGPEAPHVEAGTIARRAHGFEFGAHRRAAGLLLAVATAGTVYAFPGSPLPAWKDRFSHWLAGRPTPAVPSPSPDGVEVGSGIAVVPSEHLTIRFAATQATGSAFVSFTNGEDVVVRVVGGAASFATTADRLVVSNEGSRADYEVDLPRNAARVEIEVGARRFVFGRDLAIDPDATRDARGRLVLPLSGP